MIDRFAYDEGLLLRGTPLWFDAHRRRAMCVLTHSFSALPPRHLRAVAGEPLAHALERSGYRTPVLPGPLERWVGVGGQRFFFLDRPHRLTEAGAWVETEQSRLTMTGMLGAGSDGWPAADVAVVGLAAPDHVGLGWDAAVERVLEACGEPSPGTALVAECWEVGLAVVRRLEAQGIGVRPRGILGRLYDGPRRRSGVEVWSGAPVSAAWGSKIIGLDTGLGLLPACIARRIPVRWFADRRDVVRVVKSIGAREVFFYGLLGVPAPRLELPEGIVARYLGEPQQLTLSP